MSGRSVIETVAAYWNRRAPHFNGAAAHVSHPEAWRKALAAAFATSAPKDVVDLGCGAGACALIAASLGHNVRACDASEGMLAVARAAAESAGLRIDFEQAAVEDIPERCVADIVVLRHVMWTLQSPSHGLLAARRLLRRGGRIVVSDALWRLAPEKRSTYPADLVDMPPAHGGLTESLAQDMLTEAGFDRIASWTDRLKDNPYPGGVPAFLLTGHKS